MPTWLNKPRTSMAADLRFQTVVGRHPFGLCGRLADRSEAGVVASMEVDVTDERTVRLEAHPSSAVCVVVVVTADPAELNRGTAIPLRVATVDVSFPRVEPVFFANFRDDHNVRLTGVSQGSRTAPRHLRQ